jgi:hypothetical protein
MIQVLHAAENGVQLGRHPLDGRDLIGAPGDKGRGAARSTGDEAPHHRITRSTSRQDHRMTQQDPFSTEAAAAAQFLGGGGMTAAKFPRDGFKVGGTVTAFRMVQRTHIDSGEPLFWESKKPTEQSALKFPSSATEKNRVMQLIIELQSEPTHVTWETNRYIEKKLEEDDGMRALYISSPELQKAVGKALQDAGVRAPEVGGYLEVVKTGEQRIQGTSFTKFTYAAKYTPASQNEKAAEAYLTQAGEPADPFS